MATFDASMYRQNPLKSMQDYTDQYDQAALRQQQIQSNALSFQDRQRALAESQALRNALQSGIDPRTPEGQQKLMTVAPNAAGPIIKSLTDAAHVQAQTGLNVAQTSKAVEDTKALTWKQQIEKANKAISDIAALSSSDEAIKGITEQVKSGALDMQKATALLQSVPQDPTQFGQWQRKMLLGILDAKDRLAATKPTVVMERAGGSIVPANTNPDAGPIGTISGAASIPITQSEDNAATNARAAAEGAANRAVQMRGQNMTDQRQRDLNEITKADKEAQRQLEKTNSAVTKYSDTLQKNEIPSFEQALQTLESEFAKYKPGTTPGVGRAAGLVPDWLQGPEAESIRNAIAAVQNIQIKSRSGSAVSSSELKRNVQELGTGGFRSEETLRKAMDRVRSTFEKVKANTAAGVTEEVKNEYENRGGVKITRGGASFTSEAEAETAIKAGRVKKGDTIIVNGRKAVVE